MIDYKRIEHVVMFKIEDSDKPDIEFLINDVEQIKNFDASKFEPVEFPFEIEINNLREDNDTYTTDRELILNNANNDGQYITIAKVVK